MLINIHDSVHYFTVYVSGQTSAVVNRRYKVRHNIINILVVVK